MFEIVPVIDVKGGVAVHAVAGDRARYRPLATPLAESHDPVAVTRALAALHPLRTLYVADLDAIAGGMLDTALHASIAAAWRGSEIWLDAGHAASPTISPGAAVMHRVIGSESMRGTPRAVLPSTAPLSLDFRGEEFNGPAALLANTALWPDRVIVMTLARVGTRSGPDRARLADTVARAGPRRVYAAGGVRHLDDLRMLRDAGVAGALVATALHAGKITADDLDEVAGW